MADTERSTERENDKSEAAVEAEPADGVRPAPDPAKRNKLVGALAFLALLGVIVVVVLIGQGGDGGGDTDLDSKPVVEAKEGEPPTELETTDIVTGDGAEAVPGSEVTVQYVGVLYETGEEFDTSWGKPEPFTFELGADMVIPGWDEGIPGMKVGGRRELVIPSDLAYGPAGSPPTIGPDQALVFVVDLLDVKPPAGGGAAGGGAPAP